MTKTSVFAEVISDLRPANAERLADKIRVARSLVRWVRFKDAKILQSIEKACTEQLSKRCGRKDLQGEIPAGAGYFYNGGNQ